MGTIDVDDYHLLRRWLLFILLSLNWGVKRINTIRVEWPFFKYLWVIWFNLRHINFGITSIVPISMHCQWELQLKERHGLLPNETMQGGMDEISWKHGCGTLGVESSHHEVRPLIYFKLLFLLINCASSPTPSSCTIPWRNVLPTGSDKAPYPKLINSAVSLQENTHFTYT